MACVVLLSSLVLSGVAMAQEQPVLPAAYYGTVTVNGQPAPVGTLIVAKIEGRFCGQISVKTPGKYGGAGTLDAKLLVTGTTADEEKEVIFEVAGIRAEQTVTFKRGDVKEINLSAIGVPTVTVDTTPPTAPTNLRVTTRSSSSVSLAWDASSDNVGVAKYVVEMKQNGEEFALAGESTSTSFTKSGLAASTTYVFRVKAVDAASNESEWSGDISVTTEAAAAGGVGGGSGGGGVSTGGGGTGAPGVTPSANKIERSIEVGTATMAEITGTARVEIPAGAVTGGKARLEVTVLQETEASAFLEKAKDIQPASCVVDVAIKDGQVSRPIVITISYDPAKVPAGQVPAAYYFSEKKGCWVYLGGKVGSTNTVSVEVSHLTKFAAFAREPVVPFTDTQGHWAEEPVNRLAGMGVVKGYAGNVFKPNAEISRGECTAILVRALGLPPAGEEELVKFKDNASIPSWARSAVASAVKAELIRGYPEPDGGFTFRADNPISRAELAAIVARIMAKEVGPVTGAIDKFADADRIPTWASESVAAAAARGIVRGYEDGTFRAERNISRSEAAVMLLRLLDLVYLL